MNLYRKSKEREPRSLKSRLLLFTILCWAVPIIVFFCFTTISYQEGIMRKTEKIIEDQMESAASFISIRMEEVIKICQSLSHEKEWEKEWKSYQEGKIDRAGYLVNIYRSMKAKFYHDDRFRLYAYYEAGGEQPSCYSSRIGISKNDYMKEVDERAKMWIESGSDYTHVEIIDGRLFVMRNLYTTSDYKYFGTLVVELSKQKILKDIPIAQQEKMIVCIDNPEEGLNYKAVSANTGQKKLIEKMLGKYSGYTKATVKKERSSAYNAYLYQEKFGDYHMGIVYLAERREIYSSLYELYEVVVIMLALFVPLLAYVTHFLKKQIQEPVKQLTVAYWKMEEGDIGTQVEGQSMPNAEFNYLMDAFNSMSTQVKELFDYIYDEKLARKDAQILALQAQINPHFLNNTLEMMNWQARMSGDAVVSKMIEALGTVLDYRMNRASVREIYLADELRCTDAYFYIMSMRFGQRLQVERDIDEELLYINVPPLILQPLVENAIVHGVESAMSGSIGVHVYHDETQVYLKVTNTGKKLDKGNLDRIQAILSGNKDKIPEGSGKHISIGIRNVNERIKLVYGDEYGLSITQENNITVSTIRIPYKGEGDECIEKREEERNNIERKKMEDELKSIYKNRKEI